jgi:hypothetical protein
MKKNNGQQQQQEEEKYKKITRITTRRIRKYIIMI